MTLRRYAPLALTVLAVGCTEVSQEKPTPTLVFATFDSTNGIIPTPNDLALQGAATMDTSGANVLKTAQRNLLFDFAARRGFPADQEVSISIPFKAVSFNAGTNLYEPAATAPIVDPATATASTVALLKLSGGAVTPVAFTAETDPLDSKVLKLRKAPDATGSRRWEAGARYVVAVRGGPNGVRTTTGLPVNADQTIALVIPNRDMTKTENQPAGGLDATTAARLDGLRKLLWSAVPWCYMPAVPPSVPLIAGWNPVATSALGALCAGGPGEIVAPAASAFGAVSAAFPVEEVAAIAAFQIETAATGPYVVIDSGSGVAPLPFDLIREAVPANTAAPLDGGRIKPNPAFGSAGAGLVTLDGFSTTAMILAQTSGPITASTVAANARLYATSDGTTWTEVAALAKQPSAIVSGGFSTAIGLQPAVWAGTFPLPPLKENTKYAVVITDGVTGPPPGNAPMVRSTVSRLLLEHTAPVVYPWPVAQGTNPSTLTSLLAGLDAQTAAGIQKMRGELDSLIADRGLYRASIAAAYTFKTQTVTPTSVSLSAAPYSFETAASAALFSPASVTALPADAVCASIGEAAGCFPTVFPSVASFYTATIDSPNGIDLATGFLAIPQALWMNPGVKNTLQVLVAAPTTPADTANHLAPLVVFHHGLGRSRMDMAAIANTLAAKGFVVAAIDAPYHGSRSFCKQDSDCGGGGVCTAAVAGASLANVPGTCTTGTLAASASGNYFVSGNFFRTRDAIRQDLMDQSALVLALARPPGATPWPQPAANALAAALADIGGVGAGYAIDPTKVYFVGQSLGGIVGSEILATNPRFGRGVLNVGGGTLTDIFTQAPDFQAMTDALFLSMGIDRSQLANPAVAAAYLKTLNVAKWILDPADPINYAAYVESGLTSPIGALATGLGVTSTEVFGMAAYGDTKVPNAFNYELYGLATGLDQATYVAATSTDGALLPVTHGFLLAGSSTAATLAAQADAANFLSTLVLPADDLAGTTGTQVILP